MNWEYLNLQIKNILNPTYYKDPYLTFEKIYIYGDNNPEAILYWWDKMNVEAPLREQPEVQITKYFHIVAIDEIIITPNDTGIGQEMFISPSL